LLAVELDVSAEGVRASALSGLTIVENKNRMFVVGEDSHFVIAGQRQASFASADAAMAPLSQHLRN
jgi:hypothetical protein